jgi:hypothetical protein
MYGMSLNYPTPKYCTFVIQEIMMDLERIRQRAYEIWQQEGQPEGKQQEHWDRAVREIAGDPNQGGGELQSGADGDTVPDNLTQAADAMRGVSTGSTEGTDADQFGKEDIEPGVQNETGGGA